PLYRRQALPDRRDSHAAGSIDPRLAPAFDQRAPQAWSSERPTARLSPAQAASPSVEGHQSAAAPLRPEPEPGCATSPHGGSASSRKRQFRRPREDRLSRRRIVERDASSTQLAAVALKAETRSQEASAVPRPSRGRWRLLRRLAL